MISRLLTWLRTRLHSALRTLTAPLMRWLSARTLKRNRTWLIVDTPQSRWPKPADNHASVDVSKRIQSEWTRWRW